MNAREPFPMTSTRDGMPCVEVQVIHLLTLSDMAWAIVYAKYDAWGEYLKKWEPKDHTEILGSRMRSDLATRRKAVDIAAGALETVGIDVAWEEAATKPHGADLHAGVRMHLNILWGLDPDA